ncbi:hypothetical protein SAMN04488523_102214 [Sulfitobacter brevis]|uniref:Uncharacterized protein n=1 Tax=Sulfitobacter brevis TaxID=74348 RepID=A0A1I1UR97_9RHOB|nr:hypothetical protein [Sulfitobacter brevis]SFD73224.1 hypothetical protein SAMN04488523_102214 [Sulfitobacter brevis]
MSNIVSFRSRRLQVGLGQAALIEGFASMRRQPDDVYWLKENAELLGILSATKPTCAVADLAPYLPLYETICERLRFFPQYYRFLLSICLDLEDLGMPGQNGEMLCNHVAAAGLVQAEVSDLQRAETRRLLARRGIGGAVGQGALGARLHRFIDRSTTFAIPNRKAAYELTHIVFYLSEYGARDPQISEAAVTSLEYAGLLAFLDQNIDLLAEVCIALRFAGERPSPIWEGAIKDTQDALQPVDNAGLPLEDACHEYLVTGWAQHVAGRPAFTQQVPQGSLRFAQRARPEGVLRQMSETLFGMTALRDGDWQHMRGHIWPDLDVAGHQLLQNAERSTDKFDSFFEKFARTASV